jgi:hypothetical protein
MDLIIPLYSWEKGVFIMTFIFILIILGLLGFLILTMNNNKENEEE